MFTETEYKALLDREKSSSVIHEHFKQQISLLQDITNYGTNLIPRVLKAGNSPPQLEDALIVGVFLRHIVETVDAIHVLFSSGVIEPCFSLIRTIVEASLYIEWFLSGDTKKKATYYYISSLKQERKLIKKLLAEKEPRDATDDPLDEVSEYYVEKENSLEIKGLENIVSEIDEFLSRETVKNVSEELEKKKGKRTYELNWYQPLGITTIKSLAKELGREREYTFLYSLFSRDLHVSSYKGSISITSQGVTLKPIRYLEGIGNVLKLTIGIAIRTYRRIILKYRPDEITAFRKKYIESWRKPYQEIPKISYTEVP